jgi:hypothetical protein
LLEIVSETRAFCQARSVVAGGHPLSSAPRLAPRHVRSLRAGSAPSRRPRAARRVHRPVAPRALSPPYVTSSAPGEWAL